VVGAATSVHLAGHVGGQTPVAVDLHLTRTGGSGRVSTSGLAFTMTRIGTVAYFTANEGFDRQFMVLDDWNQRITPTPPPRPVYLVELRKAGTRVS
jgi:hypothetical protein